MQDISRRTLLKGAAATAGWSLVHRARHVGGNKHYTPSNVTWKSGVYEGAYAVARDSEVAGFETWRGHTVGIVVDFNAGNSWSAISNPSSWLTRFAASPYKGTNGDGFDFCVGMLPDDGSGTVQSTTLAAGAAGSYDSNWTTLGNNLVAAGLSKIGLRIGHEMNGNWYRWSVGSTNKLGGNPNGGYTDYINYWIRIYNALHATGWNGAMNWCPTNGVTGTADAALAYPGNAYVDIIGDDVYDASWASGSYPYTGGSPGTDPNYATKQAIAWNDIKTNARGLDYWKSFAISKGKKLVFPEWGIWTRSDNHGGMDDPTFIQNMYDYFKAMGTTLGWESYFNFTASDGDHYLGPNATNFPQSAAKYKTLWSA